MVEAELGTLAGIEDEVKVAAHEASYTHPEEVEEFVSKTGCDSLAIAIGTSHGAYKFKPEQCTICLLYTSKKRSDLKNRVALVNGTQGAILVSIHQNSLPSSKRTHGAQVFYGCLLYTSRERQAEDAG